MADLSKPLSESKIERNTMGLFKNLFVAKKTNYLTLGIYSFLLLMTALRRCAFSKTFLISSVVSEDGTIFCKPPFLPIVQY